MNFNLIILTSLTRKMSQVSLDDWIMLHVASMYDAPAPNFQGQFVNERRLLEMLSIFNSLLIFCHFADKMKMWFASCQA